MHNSDETSPESSPCSRNNDQAALSPILRLRQLAEEIRAASTRDDYEVVCQAVGLLAPTVERCRDIRDRLADSAGEAAQIALQTQQLLGECETNLTQTLQSISAEMRRLRQGKRNLALVQRKKGFSALQNRVNTMK